MKYLDYAGLTYLWNKLKSYFVSKSDFEESELVVAASWNDLNSKINNKKENVQSDWNATSGDAQILNKPNIGYNSSDGYTVWDEERVRITSGRDDLELTTGENKNINITPNGTGKLLYKGNEVLTSYTETDPTVPTWAKAATKPTYTYDEVGAAANNRIFGINFSQAPIYPYIHIESNGYIGIQDKFGSGTGATVYIDYIFPSKINNQVRIAGVVSPTFEGTPTAPTAAAGTNTTQIATTAFVNTAVASYLPLTGGTLTGTLLIDSDSMGAINHLQFNRSSLNYITFPSDGSLSLGVGNAASSSRLLINNTQVLPGYKNKTIDLGSTSYYWNNVYGTKFITSGGTSSQFVKGDGTLDSNTYVSKDQLNVCAYGTSSTAAATAQKVVTISSIESLNPGQIIVVIPTVTSTVANSTIKLNDFDAYPMRYNHAAITTSTDSIVWSANIPSIFMFDGTYWQFLGHGLDSNTTYSALTQEQLDTGTATTSRLITAKLLRDNFYTKDEIDDSSWYGTESQFNALSSLEEGVNYYIYDS